MIRIFQQSAALAGVFWFFWTTAFLLPSHFHSTTADPCADHASEDSHDTDRPFSSHHDCQLCRVDGQLNAVVVPVLVLQTFDQTLIAHEFVLTDLLSRTVLSLSNKAPPVLS